MRAGRRVKMFDSYRKKPHDGPIQVLHILVNMTQGGWENVVANIAKHSDKTQYSHHILVLGKDRCFESAFKDVPVTIHYLRDMNTSERLQLARHTDIVHVMHGKETPIVASVAKMLHKPMVVGVHNAPREGADRSFRNDINYRKVGPFIAKHAASQVVCCTDIVADAIRKKGWQPDNIRTIANGIDTDTYTYVKQAGRDLRKDLGIPEDAEVVGISARYAPTKDIPNFIKAAQLVKERNPSKPLYFIFCGKDMDRNNEALKAQLREAGIYDRSKLLGVRTDMPSVYSAIDALALSSMSNEALSLALLEGTACGCLCVATDVGDHKKLMKQTDGLCVPPSDPRALADAIDARLSLSEAEKARHMEAGRDAILKHYDVRRMASEYDALFAQAALGPEKHAGAIRHGG
jgi:glycosyltransferase involved in cell wall biosynthesis